MDFVFFQIIERFNGRLPGYIGRGLDKYSFCHIDDVVEGHIAAMNKGQAGERYLLTGENASFKHVFDIAAIITETKRPAFNIPLWLIEAYGWVSVIFSRIFGKLPLISPPVRFVVLQLCSALYMARHFENCPVELLFMHCLFFLGKKLDLLSLFSFFCSYTDGLLIPFGSILTQTVYVLRHQWAYSCEKAKVELDYKPRSLKEGLEEVLPWLKNLGLISY